SPEAASGETTRTARSSWLAASGRWPASAPRRSTRWPRRHADPRTRCGPGWRVRDVAKIVVSPERFTLVFFDADRIAELAGAVADETLSMAQSVAWTVYSEGRCERLGLPTQKARWRYHFRNRHGFSDVADAAFDRLWAGEGLTWAAIEAVCEETAKAREEFSP